MERYATRNARRDGSRPSAGCDSQRVAPTAAVPYWFTAPYHEDLPMDRANRRAFSPVVRRRPRVHPRRTARGSHSVNQSLSRPAARHEVGSAIVHGVYIREKYILFTRARGLVVVARAHTVFFPFSSLLPGIGRVYPPRIDACYRYGRICESERANAVSCTVASRMASR